MCFENCSSVRVPLVGETKRICSGLPGTICTKEVGGMVVASSTSCVVDVEACTWILLIIGDILGGGLLGFIFHIFQNGPPSSAICRQARCVGCWKNTQGNQQEEIVQPKASNRSHAEKTLSSSCLKWINHLYTRPPLA